MLSFFSPLPRRLHRPSQLSIVELIESRKMLSASPALTNMDLIGPVHKVNRVVLTFDSSLDPTTAQQPQSYIFGRIPPSSSANGITIGDVVGFLAKPHPKPIKSGKVQWSSAAYDVSTHSVTLTAIKPFNASMYFRLLRVKGTGNYTVKDTLGDPLNGGHDTLIHWTYHNGKTLRFTDTDGDVATITIRGAGHVYGFFRRTGDPAPTIFVSNTNAKSVLTGTMRQGRVGDGVARITQLLGAPAKTNLFSSSHFVVQGT
jgi:hypothetical protein